MTPTLILHENSSQEIHLHCGESNITSLKHTGDGPQHHFITLNTYWIGVHALDFQVFNWKNTMLYMYLYKSIVVLLLNHDTKSWDRIICLWWGPFLRSETVSRDNNAFVSNVIVAIVGDVQNVHVRHPSDHVYTMTRGKRLTKQYVTWILLWLLLQRYYSWESVRYDWLNGQADVKDALNWSHCRTFPRIYISILSNVWTCGTSLRRTHGARSWWIGWTNATTYHWRQDATYSGYHVSKWQIQYGSHHHYSMYADLFSQKWINMNLSNQSQTYYTKRWWLVSAPKNWSLSKG